MMQNRIDPPSKKLLTRDEAANYLNLSRKTLDEWASRGDRGPRFYRIGKKCMYTAADLVAFIESGCHDPADSGTAKG